MRVLGNVEDLHLLKAEVKTFYNVQVTVVAVLRKVAIYAVEDQICLSRVEINLKLCPVWQPILRPFVF